MSEALITAAAGFIGVLVGGVINWRAQVALEDRRERVQIGRDAERRRIEDERDAERRRLEDERDAQRRRLDDERDANSRRLDDEQMNEQRRLEAGAAMMLLRAELLAVNGQLVAAEENFGRSGFLNVPGPQIWAETIYGLPPLETWRANSKLLARVLPANEWISLASVHYEIENLRRLLTPPPYDDATKLARYHHDRFRLVGDLKNLTTGAMRLLGLTLLRAGFDAEARLPGFPAPQVLVDEARRRTEQANAEAERRRGEEAAGQSQTPEGPSA